MSFLKDMIEKARGLVSSAPKGGQAVDTVVSNRFDQALFEEVLQEAPALNDLVDDLSHNYDHAKQMVADLYNEFHQAAPRVRDSAEMKPSHLTNHAVTVDVEAAPETENTRRQTQHNKYGAVMATLAVSDRVKKFLEKNDELKEEAEKAEEAQQQAQEAAEEASQAADALEEAMGGYDGEGPLTAAQQATADALGQATASAEQHAALAEAAAQAALKAEVNAQRDMRQSVREAVSEVGDQLEAEEALLKTWGFEDGEIKQMSFQERVDKIKQLSSGKLAKYATMLGRFKHVADAQQARKVEYARDEIVDVELSGDLERMTEDEFMSSRIGGPKTRKLARLDFINRLADDELVSRKFAGTEKIGKGAVICMVDCSQSMSGQREMFAKCFALSLLDQCQQTNRDFVGINFSSARQVKVWRFPKGEQNFARVVEFVEHFFDGGTDFAAPLDTAIRILDADFNEAGKSRGDLVFITDDECGVTPEWMASYQDRKEKLGFRTFGVACGMPKAGNVLKAISTDVRAINDFMDPEGVADILRLVP